MAQVVKLLPSKLETLSSKILHIYTLQIQRNNKNICIINFLLHLYVFVVFLHILAIYTLFISSYANDFVILFFP
jgi:hypothetical protein